MDDLSRTGPILALDLGTTTGWAVRSASGAITSGTIDFKPRRYEGGGMRYLHFTEALRELNRTAGPFHRIAFEEVRRHVGVDAAHVYGGFLAHLTAWAEGAEIPYEGVPIGTWKKGIGLKGNAKKEAVMADMQRRGFLPTDDNEADAIGVLHWLMMEG